MYWGGVGCPMMVGDRVRGDDGGVEEEEEVGVEDEWEEEEDEDAFRVLDEM